MDSKTWSSIRLHAIHNPQEQWNRYSSMKPLQMHMSTFPGNHELNWLYIRYNQHAI